MKIYENKLLVSSLKKQAAECLGEDRTLCCRSPDFTSRGRGGVVESS